MDRVELTVEELRLLREVNRVVDDVLEESLRARENLEQSLRRLFPLVLNLTGAVAVAVTTMDEELEQKTFHHGDFGGVFPGTLLKNQTWGARLLDSGATFVSQPLDLVGTQVGSIGFVFEGDRRVDAAQLGRLVETVAEELDTVLASIHTAAEKQNALVAMHHAIANRVFDIGMDSAVRLLCERIRVPGFLVVYRDAVESSALHYRSYRDGELEYSSGGKRFEKLDAAIREFGPTVVQTDDRHLRTLLSDKRCVEAVLISGAHGANQLGKIMVWGDEGFSAYALDLLRLLASALTQRLIDYNRERIHLSQFFPAGVIDHLLKDPEYGKNFLTPRAEEVGILFADINSFTRICEKVLERPERIGNFVDDWSMEAVRILHKHGGTFDKMVGDCVIGLFGPPFFKESAEQRAANALKAALEIQAFTAGAMSAHPEMSRLNELLQMPGLGVAIGVNLAVSFCGLFGPNQDYSSFSTGMNQTARLQSLGSFRETLVMDSVRNALKDSADPVVKGLNFGALQETAVKNVGQPLRYYKVT